MKNWLILVVLLSPNAERLTPNAQGVRLKAEGARLMAEPVLIESGLVSGYFNEQTGVYVYKGIPYAAPPVGDLRWKSQCLRFHGKA